MLRRSTALRGGLGNLFKGKGEKKAMAGRGEWLYQFSAVGAVFLVMCALYSTSGEKLKLAEKGMRRRDSQLPDSNHLVLQESKPPTEDKW